MTGQPWPADDQRRAVSEPRMRLMYDRDGCRLFVGSAYRLDAIPDGSVHLVATSPPYWNAKDYNQWPTYPDYLADMRRAWAECWRVLCDGGRIAVNVPGGYGRHGNGGYLRIGDDTASALEAAGFQTRGVIIWDKSEAANDSTAWGSWQSASNPALRDFYEVIIVCHKGSAGREPGKSTIGRDDFMAWTKSVWRVNPQHASWHPAPFPAEIPRRLIELYTYRGDTVLDLFAGSGTTPFMAAKLGRIGLGVELKEDYVRRAAGPLFVEVTP